MCLKKCQNKETTMKTKDEILAALRKFNGAQVTAAQIREFLSKPIGKNTINWHINRLVQQGVIETQRTSSKNGNVVRVK